jgi:hypothetical protein
MLGKLLKLAATLFFGGSAADAAVQKAYPRDPDLDVVMPQRDPRELFAPKFAGRVFALRDWFLQAPGPVRVNDLLEYASPHFFLTGEQEMGFALDAAEKGTTRTSKFVRSELRHLPEWTVQSQITLSCEVRVVSALEPDRLTVLQIHGTAADGDIPPLLRMTFRNGDLFADVKNESTGHETDFVKLCRGVGAAYVAIDVRVHQGTLEVIVDGIVKLSRDVSFWAYSNYFKAGCYPQAKQGTAQAYFRKLAVTVGALRA